MLTFAHVRPLGLLILLPYPQEKASWGMATSKPPTNGSRNNTTTMDQSTGPFSTRNFYQRSVHLTRFVLLAWFCLLSVANIPVPRWFGGTGCELLLNTGTDEEKVIM